jgi:hypothetical protein
MDGDLNHDGLLLLENPRLRAMLQAKQVQHVSCVS